MVLLGVKGLKNVLFSNSKFYLLLIDYFLDEITAIRSINN